MPTATKKAPAKQTDLQAQIDQIKAKLDEVDSHTEILRDMFLNLGSMTQGGVEPLDIGDLVDDDDSENGDDSKN